MLSFVGLSVSATVLFLLGRCYAVYHWQNLVFSSQAVGFARMLSSVREVAAHTEAAQVDCCGLRTCCISWRRIVAGLNKKNIMSVIGRNEVWHCIRRSLPQTANTWDKKKTFFSGTDQDFEFGYTLLSMENILCRTFWFDRPLLWSARHCPAPSLLRDGCKEQGAKHTILLQKPKPRLHHSKDVGQQNGYIETTLSSSESGHWASESHLLCWRKETELFPLCLPLLFLQNQLCSGRAQQPSLPCESRGLWTFPNWGMSPCPEWLCAHTVSYSCAVLLQRRDRRGVQQKQHLAPGNLFMSSGGDWAKEKMTWSPQVSSWAFSLGREAWRVVFNMWFEICCWH